MAASLNNKLQELYRVCALSDPARFILALALPGAFYAILVLVLRETSTVVSPFLLYPVVLIVATVSGFWPGVLNTALSTLLVWTLGLMSSRLSRVHEVVSLAGFCLGGIALSVVGSFLRKAHANTAVFSTTARFVEEAPFALAMFDRQMRYLAANHRWRADTDTEMVDLVGRSHYEVFPNLPAHWREAHIRGLNGETVTGNDTWVSLNGSSRTIHWVIQPWGDEGTHTGGIIIFDEDITEQKRAEEALRLTERRWITTLMSIGDAVVTCDLQGRVTFLNTCAQALTGFTDAEALGKPIQDLFPLFLEDSDIPAQDVVGSALREGQAHSGNTPIYLRANRGRKVPVAVNAVGLRDSTGAMTGGVIVYKNVTDQRMATSALRDSERFYRLLFSNMNQGFAECEMVYDDSGNPVDFVYLSINATFSRITGLRHVIGKKASELLPGIGRPDPNVVEIYHRVASTGKSVQFERHVPWLDKWFSVSAYCLRTSRFIVLFEDITARKTAEFALRESEQRLRTLVERASDSYFVHDIQGRFIDVNQQACSSLGYTREELLRMTVWDIQTSLDTSTAQAFWRSIRPGTFEVIHVSQRRKDGSTFPVEVNVYCKATDNNLEFYGIVRNLSMLATGSHSTTQSVGSSH